MTPPVGARSTSTRSTSAFVNTRGRVRHRDYDFLCAAPPEAWWRGYAGHTTFERPTILVESDGERHRMYLSGIPSARRDAVGSTIRYTVVVEDGPDDRGEGPAGLRPSGARSPEAARADHRSLVGLVAWWLADQDPADGGRRVSAALDAAFPEPDVEQWLTGPGDAAEVRRRLLQAIRSLPPPVREEVPDTPPDWLGGLGAPRARAAFLERVDELVADRPGRALVLNLVDSPADVAGLLADGRPLAVLAPELAAPTTITALSRERVDAGKKAPPPARAALPEPARTPPIPAASAAMSTAPAGRTMPRRTPGSAVDLLGCLRLVIAPMLLVVALGIAVVAVLLTR